MSDQQNPIEESSFEIMNQNPFEETKNLASLVISKATELIQTAEDEEQKRIFTENRNLISLILEDIASEIEIPIIEEPSGDFITRVQIILQTFDSQSYLESLKQVASLFYCATIQDVPLDEDFDIEAEKWIENIKDKIANICNLAETKVVTKVENPVEDVKKVEEEETPEEEVEPVAVEEVKKEKEAVETVDVQVEHEVEQLKKIINKQKLELEEKERMIEEVKNQKSEDSRSRSNI